MSPSRDEPRYTIKLVTADHLNYPMFTGVGLAKNKQLVMNFKASPQGLIAARKVKAGDKAIVYVGVAIKGFIWAIEYLDSAFALFDEQGDSIERQDWDRAAWLAAPIRFLAKRDTASVVSVAEAEHATGFLFKANSFTEKEIDPATYASLEALIAAKSDVRPDPQPPVSHADAADGDPVPDRDPKAAADVPTRGQGRAVSAEVQRIAAEFADLLPQLDSAAAMPERHVEDLVKQVLVRLGIPSTNIRFQVGRMDVSVVDDVERTLLVVEVKRSLAKSSSRDQARRQGFDYAMQSGSPLVLLTDGRVYLLYDRACGHRYDDAFLGKAVLSDLDETGADVLMRLRQLREQCQAAV